MALTIRQLKYFTAVAEVGRISQAAVQLNISQSAVTTSVRELEEMLNQSLFERHAHGVELTHAGRRFLSHAYAVLAAIDAAERMPNEETAVEGRLTIAASYTVLGYFLPHHLQRFAQLHPHIHVKVHEAVRQDIEEGLVTRRYDMGLMLTSNVALTELSIETFFGSHRRLWVCSKHHLLKNPEVTLADVAKEPYVMLTVDEAAAAALKYWSQTPLQPDIRLRTSSVEAARSMVANGMGVSILSDMVYRPWSLEGRRIETINLRDEIPPMNVGLGWKQGIDFSPAMTAFRNYFKQHFLDPGSTRSGRGRP
ncbi:LysR family transcriptional regulator [Verminephrobacter aporrectodeae]|uniref:LysR family transcriptional regulator n=1 Tax=Verminephrobacter aporrectodeae TaxID=1110389 RepID=UPI002244ED07|nr:LysR family transcriptional regulator [Verminephrobacter aporrectodeae]MCW8173898.1 LysR family transcriptional regulator [Verminephrobacter aporrectodeae subsp. tuberculatae]MCW8201468.1 LysR family transcriptional regulator [Verminephrobacter aporrectodeae subsp. tuberculatae]